MIAVDTSSLIAYLSGSRGEDVEAIDAALEYSQISLPPVVLAEVLSDPALPENIKELLRRLPLLRISEGYWERTGQLRAQIISRGRKARLADSLVAQSCLDHDLPLVTRDSDFKHFARLAGLRLL